MQHTPCEQNLLPHSALLAHTAPWGFFPHEPLRQRLVPAQSAVLAAAGQSAEVRSGVLSKAKLLSMTSGIFGLLWLIVLVLMVVKPGHHRG